MQLSLLTLALTKIFSGGGAGSSLNLDMTSGNNTLDSRITFTRASSATRTNNAGLIESVSTDQPRFDYDPVTLQPKGLLIEEQRTNLLTYSEQFDNAAWTKTRASIVANATVAPDGTMTADKLVGDTTLANSHSYLYGSDITVNSGSSYTYSVYAKASELRFILLRIGSSTNSTEWGVTPAQFFDLSTGLLGTSIGTVNGSIVYIGNGWYRCSITGLASVSGNTRPQAFASMSNGSVVYDGDGVSGLYLWGAQLEAGAFPTSYIPTTSAQVTRAADSASMTGANFTSWYNPSEGTFFTTADSLFSSSSFPTACVAHDGTSNNVIYLSIRGSSSSGRQEITTGGVSQVASNSGAISSGSSFSESASYKLNDCSLSVNGLSAVTDTSATIPAVTTLSIGSERSVTGYLNGHIKRLAYWPRRLSNSELQSITS